MSLCSSWRFSGSLSFNRCTRTGARAPEWLVQNKSSSPEYSWAASKLRESYFGLINVLQLQSHLASNRGACKQGITVLGSAMDGTGKCYWLDCALLNAPFLIFFFSPSSFFLLRPEFGLAVLRVLSICISPPVYLFISLFTGTRSLGNYWQLLESPCRGEFLPCSSQACCEELEQLCSASQHWIPDFCRWMALGIPEGWGGSGKVPPASPGTGRVGEAPSWVQQPMLRCVIVRWLQSDREQV